jgi:hypothetical protein
MQDHKRRKVELLFHQADIHTTHFFRQAFSIQQAHLLGQKQLAGLFFYQAVITITHLQVQEYLRQLNL